MFEKLGQIASLMKNLPRMQEEMGKLQGRIAQISAEGDAGGGMVKAKVTTEPLEKINDVFNRMKEGKIDGRVVLTL